MNGKYIEMFRFLQGTALVVVFINVQWFESALAKVECSFCPETRSFRNAEGYFDPEGCEQDDVKHLIEYCKVCRIDVVADTDWPGKVKSPESEGENEPRMVPYKLPEGKVLKKGCAGEDIENDSVGTCDFTGKLYICYCKGALCNKNPPPCAWFKKATPGRKEFKGCMETAEKKNLIAMVNKRNHDSKENSKRETPENGTMSDITIIELIKH